MFSVKFLIELLLLIGVLMIPLIPVILAWLKGSEKLKVVREKYHKAIEVTFKRIFNATTSHRVVSPLESIYEATNGVKAAGKVWLRDRRAYTYYLLKIFNPLKDMISFSITTQYVPGCSMIIVSRSHRSLVEQAIAYAEQLEYVEIGGLEDYLILTDNLTGIRHVLDRFIVQELVNMKKWILYIIIDYSEPNVEFYIEVTDKDYAESIPRAVMLVKNIMERTRRVSPRREMIDTIKKLKRALRLRE